MFSKLRTPYFCLLVTILMAVIALEVGLTFSIPKWREFFYNTLQHMRQEEFIPSIIYLILLMSGLGVVQGLKNLIVGRTAFEVRRSVSKFLLKRWVKHKRKIKNYTQAQTESLQIATYNYLVVLVEVVIAAGCAITLMIGSANQPRILIAAVVYSVAVSVAAMLFNRPMTTANKLLQTEEGTYRDSLAEIAINGGDFTAKEKFLRVAKAMYVFLNWQFMFALFGRVKSGLASVVPYFLMGAAYFSKDITLGQFMSAVATFELITLNTTIVIVMYPELMRAKGALQLVKEFKEGIER